MTTKLSRMSLALLVLALVLSVFAVQGCSSNEGTVSYGQSDTAEEPVAPAEDPADDAGEPMTGSEPLYTPEYKPNGTEIVVIETAKGTIKFEFYSEDAPIHTAAFIELANKGFYNDTTFHRVEPGFVVQGGDPNTRTGEGPAGTGGPGYTLAAEFNSRQHLDGSVAMARAQDPNSAGSQFYICLGPQPFLDGQYTVFGQVTEGLDIVRSIAVGDVMTSVTIENSN